MPSLPQSALGSIPTQCQSRGASPLKKMLTYNEQSQYVYENKGNMDILTATKSDIYCDMTWILQKNSGYDGQFVLIDTFRPGFVQPWRRKSPSRQSRGSVAPRRGRRSFAITVKPVKAGRQDVRPCRVEDLAAHCPQISPMANDLVPLRGTLRTLT